MKAIYPITFIISSNDINDLEKDLTLSGIDSFKRVLGRFKGVEETSLVVLTDCQRTILALAKRHKQENVLKLDMTRFATLLGTDGSTTPLGQFVGQTAKPDGDYTFDGKQYFTTIKEDV